MAQSKLTKEDIQAIAEELAKHHLQGASTRAQPTEKPSQKNGKSGEEKSSLNHRSIATIGLILVWALVFVALAIKVAPYI